MSNSLINDFRSVKRSARHVCTDSQRWSKEKSNKTSASEIGAKSAISFLLQDFIRGGSVLIDFDTISTWNQNCLVKFIENTKLEIPFHQSFLCSLQRVCLKEKNYALEALYNFLNKSKWPDSTEEMAAWGCACKAYLYNLSSCRVAEYWTILLTEYEQNVQQNKLDPQKNWMEMLLFQTIVDLYSVRLSESVSQNQTLIVKQCEKILEKYLKPKIIDDAQKSVTLTYAILGILVFASDNELTELNKKYSESLKSDWFADCNEYILSEISDYQSQMDRFATSGQKKIDLARQYNQLVSK